jgi:hypothetical protein
MTGLKGAAIAAACAFGVTTPGLAAAQETEGAILDVGGAGPRDITHVQSRGVSTATVGEALDDATPGLEVETSPATVAPTPSVEVSVPSVSPALAPASTSLPQTTTPTTTTSSSSPFSSSSSPLRF